MSTTANLGMTLPAGTDWADIAVLNANFELIDAAMTAARAAEAYSEAKTYAVGDYCTHDGKLYKCTTAITVAEAWNPAHWAETSVGAELLAIDLSLSNKADWNGGALGSDVLLWALSQSAPLSILVVPNTPNTPDTSMYWYVSVMPYPAGSSYDLTAVSAWDGTTWKNTYTSGAWAGWVRLATATPPTPHDLLVSSGVTNYGGLSDYNKDQFGKVLVNIAVSVANSTDAHKVVATLPVGFRPISNAIAAGCLQKVDGSQVYARVAILVNGDIRFEACPTDGSTIYLFGNVSFNAGN